MQTRETTTTQPTAIGARHLLCAGFLLVLSVGCAWAQGWVQTSAPATNWSSLASSADGRTLVAAAGCPYCGPGFPGPIYLSTNSGTTWTQTSAPLTNWNLVACSADGTQLFAATLVGIWNGGGGVYRSTDAGASWLPLTNGPDAFLVATSADGTRLVAAGNSPDGGLFTSTNSGSTWSRKMGQPLSNWVAIACSADGRTVVAGDIFMHSSTNAGETWMESDNIVSPAPACSADGTRVVSIASPGVWTSTNSGGTWDAGTPFPGAFSWSSSVACSADAKTVISAGTSFAGAIYLSRDWGATWVAADAPLTNWSAVACSADGGSLAAAVSGGGIYTYRSAVEPSLHLAPLFSNLLVSWTVPSSGFVLEESQDLTPNSWTGVSITPVLDYTNLQSQVTVPLSAGNHFYRLKY